MEKIITIILLFLILFVGSFYIYRVEEKRAGVYHAETTFDHAFQ